MKKLLLYALGAFLGYWGYLKWEFSDANIRKAVQEFEQERGKFENEAMYFDSVTVEGKQISYKVILKVQSHRVDLKALQENMGMAKEQLKKDICGWRTAQLALRHGITIDFDFRTADRAKVEYLELDMNDCGLKPPPLHWLIK